MCFKNQWYFGKKIITTDVSDAIIDIREKNKGYVISLEEENMVKEIENILKEQNLEEKKEEYNNIYEYIKENNESSDKIYKDILEIVKE